MAGRAPTLAGCLRACGTFIPTSLMEDRVEDRATPRWLDILWLVFLISLALLPPAGEMHKHFILMGIGIFQLLEPQFLRLTGNAGPSLAVLVKIGLASLLIGHTADVAPITSSYWPIFLLPVMTAAMYFGPLGTLLWTTAASAAYCAYLIPARLEFDITRENVGQLLLRIVFFFMVAMIVNRFVIEYRLQARRYQALSETLSEANRNLKQAQAEARRAERLAALGQLSAGLAHEIRNPLGVMKGSAELLNQRLEGSDSLSRELSEYIYTEVNRLSALVSRFLDFARPSRLELHPADLTAVMERSLKAVEQQGATAQVKITREYSASMPPVRVDQELCEQAFTNLLFNACEAMGEAGGELKIRVRPASGGKEVVAEIEDTGPGVPADMREQIFNPFVSTKKTGVGLGLAIVSKIIDGHGGTIKLIDPPGHGACFRVTLPAG
ncbi:MAG TPA: ATP-binding protein [Candidatus Angelobacter sp.]|nr:ATP-binding protein [Candidatus Angelobacter sp.]